MIEGAMALQSPFYRDIPRIVLTEPHSAHKVSSMLPEGAISKPVVDFPTLNQVVVLIDFYQNWCYEVC
jgi:hypothetical protein